MESKVQAEHTLFLDGSWWFGGNRQRGIGRYIDAFLRYELPKHWEVYWLLPPKADAELITKLTRRYGGKSLTLAEQEEEWENQLRSFSLFSPENEVWILSPFERPFSLVDVLQRTWNQSVDHPRLRVLIFDVLPLQYPKQILATWSPEDQELYRQRYDWLRLTVDSFWAISAETQRQLISLLSVNTDQIVVPQFATSLEWLNLPAQHIWNELDRPQTWPYAVTISGGEWRKNLAGTLKYFAQTFPKHMHLVVMNRLGKREYLGYWWMAVKLGLLGRIHFLGYVKEQDKWQWLLHASVFLFLSKAEGLGIPILEARRAGIPRIIVSKRIAETVPEILPEYVEIKSEIKSK